MSRDLAVDLHEFHTTFGFVPRKVGDAPSAELVNFRLKFMVEELRELNKGFARRDMEEVLDGLVDLVYVAIGTAWMLGLPFQAAWDEVQRANMTKVRATDASQSRRSTTLDVVKPAGWKKPDIKALIHESDLALKIEDLHPDNEQLDLVNYITDQIEEEAEAYKTKDGEKQ